MAQRIKAETEPMPEVILTGTLDREGIRCILDRADVMICPSREDPMPTVAAEAMRHSVPCILSDATGTAAYVMDGADGFIFPNENVEALSAKIRWCIDHREKIFEVGIQARKIYETYFSTKVFERNLLEIVEKAITV